MEVATLIRRQRSVRKFKKRPVCRAEIRKILEAGRWAPSGLNNQPWRFLVISDQKKREGLSAFTTYSSVITGASAAILVFLDTASSYHREKDLMAIGACIQNMLLRAASLGLGTCWLGEILNRKEKVSAYLNIRAGLELMAVIAVGYPARRSRSPGRKSLKSFTL